MLQETKNTRQFPGEPFRRWFTDSSMDLIVWFDTNKAISGFQLCYKDEGEEKALTWFSGRGFSHKRIDDGEDRPTRHKMTPILVPDGAFEKHRVSESFMSASQELDPAIRSFVHKTLAEYPEK